MPAHRKDYSTAEKMYNDGSSLDQVATAHGITRQSMHKILSRRSVAMRPNLRYGNDNHFFRGGSVADDEAQNDLEWALAQGKITRPDSCEQCGSSERFSDGRTSIQGHHTDYNKPLVVMWLCQKCHHNWHIHNTPIAKGESEE